jgi:hypothetical protein
LRPIFRSLRGRPHGVGVNLARDNQGETQRRTTTRRPRLR